jgi:alpha-L-rhamnosidase
MIAIRAMVEFAAVVEAFSPELASYYNSTAEGLVAGIRQNPLWYQQYGLHSSADAVNAKFTTQAENAAIFAQNFNDSVLICSYSSFNMYWVLQVGSFMY